MEEYFSGKISNGRLKQGLPVEHDCKNVVVVASAWLLFYVVMLSGLLSSRGRDLLASAFDVLAQN
jgi:hypothetical protein